jgi:20S proteasome alpha/beta subunit
VTLIVGVLATDGAVVGSDGAATLGGLQSTVRQSTSKIRVLPGAAILGVSGPAGLAQRFEDELRNLEAQGTFRAGSPASIGSTIRNALWDKVLQKEFAVANQAQALIGQSALLSALSQSILVLPIDDKPVIFQFDQQGAPELATPELPFVAIGSGEQIADPFLAFLKRVFWKNRPPSLTEATFAVLWTLQHATEVHPGGVAPPISMFNLRKTGGSWDPHCLDEKDLAEHKVAILALEAYVGQFARAPSSSVKPEKEAGPPTPA